MNWQINSGVLLLLSPKSKEYGAQANIGFEQGQTPPSNNIYITTLLEGELVYVNSKSSNFLLHRFWDFYIPTYVEGKLKGSLGDDIHILEVDTDNLLQICHLPAEFTAECSTQINNCVVVTRELEPMLYTKHIIHAAPETTWATKSYE